MKNKISILCFFLLMMIRCLAQIPTETETELDKYYEELSQNETVQLIFCFKINSPTTNVSMELLFGTCAIGGISEANTFLPPGTVDGSNPVDFYILHSSQAWNVFFTENHPQAEWILVIRTPCILNFTRKCGAVPDEGGSLKLFNGENELLNIVNGSQTGALAVGEYAIRYVPAPDKSTVPDDVTFTFQPGWNLLHFPMVIYEKETNVGWAALNALPRMTLSGRTYVKGGDIRCGEAFWVFYDGEFKGNIPKDTLTVEGFVPLATDWVERPSTGDWDFANTNDASAKIYEWAGRYKIPTSLDSSKGYWIKKTP